MRRLISESSMLVQLDDFGDTQLFDDKTIYSAIILLQKHINENFIYSSVTSAPGLWAKENVKNIVMKASTLDESPWKLTTDLDFMALVQKLEGKSVLLEKHANIFNGIQTSAERPVPIYWFSSREVRRENKKSVTIERDGQEFIIEKALLKPYFKPTLQSEKGLNSYSLLTTDKRIIFPYDKNGNLIPKEKMETSYSGTYTYLKHYYEKLIPRQVSSSGVRDVPGATADTWYQYGRTQVLASFINTPKLIVGILSRDPMYANDETDMLIASGGTAGYCAISKKPDSPYSLEYLQAWLSNPYTEQFIRLSGSFFEGGFVARGTFILKSLPFVELDFSVTSQKIIHDEIVGITHKIYDINNKLSNSLSRHDESVLNRQKKALITEIESRITHVYRLEFQVKG